MKVDLTLQTLNKYGIFPKDREPADFDFEFLYYKAFHNDDLTIESAKYPKITDPMDEIRIRLLKLNVAMPLETMKHIKLLQ